MPVEVECPPRELPSRRRSHHEILGLWCAFGFLALILVLECADPSTVAVVQLVRPISLVGLCLASTGLMAEAVARLSRRDLGWSRALLFEPLAALGFSLILLAPPVIWELFGLADHLMVAFVSGLVIWALQDRWRWRTR